MKLILAAVSTVLLLNSCTKTVYVPVPCPKLVEHTYSKKDFKPLAIDYEVIK